MRKPETAIAVRGFLPGDEIAFRRLNEEWITRHFLLEAKDEIIFANPKESILDTGGRIFFALRDGEIIGCCALLAMGPGEFEISKMTVAESYREAGVGRQLLQKVIDEARASGTKRLYLETNRKLNAAIRLYESVGFRHLPPERIVRSPYVRADVYMELNLPYLRQSSEEPGAPCQARAGTLESS